MGAIRRDYGNSSMTTSAPLTIEGRYELMKRLFALGGVVMLLLCFTVPAQATIVSKTIDFEDYAAGTVFGMQYAATHHVMNMMGMFAKNRLQAFGLYLIIEVGGGAMSVDVVNLVGL